KQRRLARNSAILSKLKTNDVMVIDKLEFAAPKTKEFVAILKNLNITRSCLIAVEDHNLNVYKSVRNIPTMEILEVDQLNAGDICNKRKLLLTKKSLECLVSASN
ncbi:MAG: 50S ribosomal protein L4, partial [Sedimentisphaerales bacterium]|nr:50S ribosomal protein L4 [Sedimentisphaerales bacterium]